MLAAFYDESQYRTLKEAGPINTEYPIMGTPLATLLKEISDRPSIRSFHFRQTGA